MIKKTIAMLLVMLCLFTSLAACGSAVQDKIDQIQTEFNALVTEVADVSALLLTTTINALNLPQIIDKFDQVKNFITSFATTVLTDLSDAGLDALLSQISSMKTILDDLKTLITSSGSVLPSGTSNASADDLALIQTEIASMKTTLEEVKNQLLAE